MALAGRTARLGPPGPARRRGGGGGFALGGAGGSAGASAGLSAPGGIGSSATATLTSAERRLYDYVSAHRDGASYLMAVDSWESASPYILATGQRGSSPCTRAPRVPDRLTTLRVPTGHRVR